MLGILRRFSKYANIQELGKLPSEVNKHLKALGDLTLYKSMRGDKAVLSLDLLFKASKKKVNLLQVNWLKYPEIQVMLSELPSKLTNYTLRNIIDIMKTCSKLNIHDSNLWLSIENAITSNLYELEERQLYDLISCFSKRKNTNISFWQELESIITTKFCPKHNIQAHVVCMILTTYSKLNILSDQFLTILEQQVIRVHLNFDSIEVSKVLNVFVQRDVGSEGLYDKLCKQVKLMVYSMDWYSTVISLVSFVRIGRGDHVDEIEKCAILWLDRMDAQQFSSIFVAYGRNLPVAIRKETERRKFLCELAEFLQKKGNKWEGDERSAIGVMWGLAVGKIFQFEELWKRLAGCVKGKREFRDLKEYEKIESILKENEKLHLLD